MRPVPIPPIGRSEKTNVALQRPTVNLREAENLGEEAVAAASHIAKPELRFSKHGTFFATPAEHVIEKAWDD